MQRQGSHRGLDQACEIAVTHTHRIGMAACLEVEPVLVREHSVHVDRQAVQVAEGGHGAHLAVGEEGGEL